MLFLLYSVKYNLLLVICNYLKGYSNNNLIFLKYFFFKKFIIIYNDNKFYFILLNKIKII